jgi:hypothetical protein
MAFNLADTYSSFLIRNHSDSEKIRSEKRNEVILNHLSENLSPNQFSDQLKQKKTKTFLGFSGRFSFLMLKSINSLSGMPANNDAHNLQIKHDKANGLPDQVSAKELGPFCG